MLDSTTSQSIYRKSADIAYDAIRDAILSGRLVAGEKLSLRNMAKLAGVSNIPVMQALHRLENEGIVESNPYLGARVVELSEDKIKDRYALREAVECQVARILSHRLTEEQYKSLLNSAADLDLAEQKPGMTDESFWYKHHEFHMSLARYTSYKSLEKSLYAIGLFTLLRFADNSSFSHHLSLPRDNHKQLVESIYSGDADEAEKAMRLHISRSEIVDIAHL